MRLGYTVLLEWGNSIYTTNGIDKEILRNTLIEDMFFKTESNTSYLEMLSPIASKRKFYNGNYDALLGKISNFNWSFNPDGSYSIELTIISLGDVVESLKSNLAIDQKTQKFFDNLTTPTPDPATDPPEETIDEEDTQTDIITAMLSIYKYVNIERTDQGPINIITAETAPEKYKFVGRFLSTTQEGNPNNINGSKTTYKHTLTYTTQNSVDNQVKLDEMVMKSQIYNVPLPQDLQEDIWENIKIFGAALLMSNGVDLSGTVLNKVLTKEDGPAPNTTKAIYEQEYNSIDGNIKEQIKDFKKEILKKIKQEISDDYPILWDDQIIGENQDLLPNPLSDSFVSNDAFKLNDKDKNHYLRFGALLTFLKNNVIPITNGNKNIPLFNIDDNDDNSFMYSLPNQISLDPRVCLVRNDKFNTIKNGITQVFPELDPFKLHDTKNNKKEYEQNIAYPLNIYLNFNFIKECLATDKKGNVSVFNFLSNICTGLNKALGGINQLEPVMDEETNYLRIIDSRSIPGTTNKQNPGKYELQIYGYNKEDGINKISSRIKNNYISNFVRKIDLRTTITPDYATMITIGATAGGYVKGTEATAFSKWNTGLVDRFKEKFTSPSKVAAINEDEPKNLYLDNFLLGKGKHSRYGFTGLSPHNNPQFQFSDNFIEKNISTVTEYYKWLIAKNAEGKDISGGTIGFIPFRLNLTLDGISGIKIYNVLHVNTEFLPRAYGKTVDLIVTGVSHRLNDNDWETSIETTVMPKIGAIIDTEITIEDVQNLLNNATTKKKGADIIPKDPNKLCGLANAKNVNTVYPKSVKWQGGKAPVIVTPTKSPSVTINLKNVPKVARISTTYTSKQVIEGAKKALNRMAPSASDKYKKLIITSALTVAIKEQSLKGFNNNLTGVEASGFKLFTKDEVVGKVILPEGQGTGKIKEYYAFKDLSSGLVPVISKILERNMFATGGTANEFAWRYFRDWNGYGGRTTEHYALPSNQKSKAGVSGYDSDDCKIISGIESAYDKAAAYVKQYY
jgi:hypothetical protein